MGAEDFGLGMQTPPETIEFLSPPKEIQSVILEILAQNRMILEMNERLLKVMGAPPMVIRRG